MCKKEFMTLVIFAILQTGCKDANQPSGLNKGDCDTSTCFVQGNNWKMAVSTNGTFGYDPYDLDNNFDNAGGIFPSTNFPGSIYAAGIFIGATKNGVPSVTMARYISEFTQGRIINSTPTGIENLVYSDSALDVVNIIDQSRSGYSWEHWPNWAGAPVAAGEPEVLSAEDSWIVFHDADSSAHAADMLTVDANPILGIEVQQSTYSFTGSTVEDVFFVRWRITNKSDINYSDMYVGLWCDADVITSSDDLVGSDTLRNMVYVHNKYDISFNNISVGIMTMYSSDLSSSVVPAAMLKYSKSGDSGRQDDGQFNLLKGLNGDGTPRTNVVLNHPTFDFPGDPVTGVGIVDTTASETRVLISTGPLSLNSGQTKEFVFAVIGSQGSDRLDAIVQLRNTADALKQIFASQIAAQLGY